MKKIMTVFMTAVLSALSCIPAVSHAESYEGVTDDGFHYFTDGEEAVMINMYDGTNSDVVIPEEIGGVPVRYISRLFIKSPVTSVVMPSAMINSGFNYSNQSLKKIEFLSDSINFDGNLSGTGIKELVFPNVDNINSGAFKNCKNLRKVVYGGTVTKIEAETYSGCTSLAELDFADSNSSVSIMNRAFANTGFVNLELSPPVQLAGAVFDNCKNLETVKFESDVSMTGTPFSNCNAIKSVEFNGNVNIQDYAFRDCPLLENLSFDASKEINGRFFKYCENVRYINNEPAFDESTGDFNPDYKDFIIKSFGNSDDVGFVNDYVMWHVRDIVGEYISDDMTDMEKVKTIHDWVCDNVSYSTDTTSDSINHNDLSPFLTGVTVCDGYARAFNLLANEAGIETYYVRSNNHIWNIVKLGGHYFHVDTTWDDTGSCPADWFLKSDNEMRAETSSHSSWTLQTPSSLHNFQKDTLPECEYSMGDCNADGKISVADIVKMNLYLLGADTVSSEDCVLYDLDFSGSIDVFDMIEMRRLIAENSCEIPYSDDIRLMSDWLVGKTDFCSSEWDLNQDGRIDVFDMILMRKSML